MARLGFIQYFILNTIFLYSEVKVMSHWCGSYCFVLLTTLLYLVSYTDVCSCMDKETSPNPISWPRFKRKLTRM